MEWDGGGVPDRLPLLRSGVCAGHCACLEEHEGTGLGGGTQVYGMEAEAEGTPECQGS